MKTKFLFVILLLMSLNYVFTQNVGINASGSTPAASAGLDIDFSNKGVLVPRINLQSNTDVVTIPSPVVSLMVYNTGATLSPAGFYYWNGTNWINFGAQGATGAQGPVGPTGATGPAGPAGTAATPPYITAANSATATTNNNYKDNWTPATTIPAGTYAVTFCATITNTSTSGTPSIKVIRNDNNSTVAEMIGISGTAGTTVSTTVILTLSNATTFKFQTSRGFGGTSSITTTLYNPTILALPVAP